MNDYETVKITLKFLKYRLSNTFRLVSNFLVFDTLNPHARKQFRTLPHLPLENVAPLKQFLQKRLKHKFLYLTACNLKYLSRSISLFYSSMIKARQQAYPVR